MPLPSRSIDSPSPLTCARPARRALLLGSILLWAASLAALPSDRSVAQYVRRSWTVEQGLPHGTVRGFAQTADGYLWLATYEGLVRFNGERFRIFDQSSNPEFPNSSILTVRRTRDDSVWLGTAEGLMQYREGKFLPISGIPKGLVNALEEDSGGALWVGNWGGLGRVVGGEYEPAPFELPSDLVNTLLAEEDGTLWVGTAEGLLRRGDGGSKVLGVEEGLSAPGVLTLLLQGPGSVYAGTTSGLNIVRGDTIERVKGIPADQITALHRDADGYVWVGTYSSGLFRMRGDEVSAYGITDGLLNPTVRAIFEDGEGSIWVGTNRGMEQLRRGAFVTWRKQQGLSDDFTRAIFEDDQGVLWVGTSAGLNRFDDGQWSKADDPRLAEAYVLSIAQSPDGTHWFGSSNGLFRVSSAGTTLLTAEDGLPGSAVRVIHPRSDGEVWVASDSGVARIRVDGSVESFSGRGGLGTDYAIAIAETPDGRLWVATGKGLGEFDGNRFVLHSTRDGLPSSLLFSMTVDSEGTLWLGTDGDGLIRYRDGEARQIRASQGLATDKILSIVDDGRGSLWIGSARGVSRVDKKALHAIADGKAERVVVQVFDESDGLGSRQCNGSGHPAAYRTRDGRIWFATAGGISALDPSSNLSAPLVRTPVVERVSVDGKAVPAEAIESIPPGAERIEFEFTGMGFVAPDRLRFRYKVQGYDRDWNESGDNRIASYTNLPAGAYQFIVATSRNGGEWQSSALPFVLRPHFWETRWFIALAVLAAVAVLLTVHLMRIHLSRERARQLEKVVHERTRQIQEEKERTELALLAAEAAKREAERHEELTERALAQAEEANRAKSIFLATTSHELRTPLNAIIGFSDILLTRAAERLDARDIRFLENINSSGDYLLGIINNILDLSKVEAGKMELQPETIVLREAVAGICAVMKGVTTSRKITIEVDIPSDLPKFEADPTLLKQILYNLMSNAVKFSPERSTVTVAARHIWPVDSPLGENAVEVRVIDQGTGIAPSDHQLIFQEFRQAHGTGAQRPEGTGLGLALVKRFVEMHRGMIRVDSEPGKGSTFTVILPCRHQPLLVSGEVVQKSPMAKL